jgi:hypothetical protein
VNSLVLFHARQGQQLDLWFHATADAAPSSVTSSRRSGRPGTLRSRGERARLPCVATRAVQRTGARNARPGR